MFLYDGLKWWEDLKYALKKILVTEWVPWFTDRLRISDMVTLGKKTAAPPLALLLNAGFVEVNLHRQRPGLLGRIWLFHRDGDHGTQVVRVDFVGIIQELLISVDTQLKGHKGVRAGTLTDTYSTLAHLTLTIKSEASNRGQINGQVSAVTLCSL